MNTLKQILLGLIFDIPLNQIFHKLIKMWLVISNSKIKTKKGPNQIKLTWGCFVKKSFFDSLFLVNLSVFPWDFCVFWKGNMYGYLYCENRGLEWLLDNVGFVSNLNINAENLPFFMFLKPYLRA